MRIRTFCPGHITGFFQVMENDDPLQSGSRGAGMCIELGARCSLDARPGHGNIRVSLDGKELPAPATTDAVRGLDGSDRMDFEIKIEHDLPVGQGFGMSAAGAISAAYAASAALGIGLEDALISAHVAELKNHTGLGDVAALSRGGVTFRRKEGIPPYGRIERIDGAPEVVLCVIGAPVSTASMLSNPETRSRASAIGADCVTQFARWPDLQNLMRLSKDFMNRMDLASEEVEEAVIAAEKAGGMASMVMLGNSVFAVGPADRLSDVLSAHGKVCRCNVDLLGPRLL